MKDDSDSTPTLISDDTTESMFDDVKSIIWIPDPEARRGWRECYVREIRVTKPGARFGFR